MRRIHWRTPLSSRLTRQASRLSRLPSATPLLTRSCRNWMRLYGLAGAPCQNVVGFQGPGAHCAAAGLANIADAAAAKIMEFLIRPLLRCGNERKTAVMGAQLQSQA